MVSDVSIAAMIIMITATSPGTIMFRLTSSSLYHTRLSSCTGAASRAPASLAAPAAYDSTTAWV